MMGPHASGRAPVGEAQPFIRLEVDLARDVGAPAVARGAVRGVCRDLHLDPSLARILLLLVSEVVTNAVVHSRAPADAPVVLAVKASDEVVQIAVTDGGDGFTPKRRDPTQLGRGYGLYLLDRVASRWGIDRSGGARVWFELPRSARFDHP
jgi:anti-sigma regulatory factor (Ser/Thr protein kinase)